MDVADPAVLEQRRGDEQPVVARLLDERDDADRSSVSAASVARRGSSSRIATSDGEVLEQVAGQPQLGEDDEPGALRRGPRASSSWWTARFSSNMPSRGAIWASAIRSGVTNGA